MHFIFGWISDRSTPELGLYVCTGLSVFGAVVFAINYVRAGKFTPSEARLNKIIDKLGDPSVK